MMSTPAQGRLTVAGTAERDEQAAVVFAYADKTMLRISGLSVRGLNAGRLEEMLTRELNSLVRVIGVTGQSIDMDVYGLDEANILRDEKKIIKAVALAEGITLTDLASLACSGKTTDVEAAGLTRPAGPHCAGERWKHGA
jgi:hypothetical protein